MRSLMTVAALIVLMTLTCAGQSSQSNPCALSQQRQFDFWLGNWDLTWPGEKSGEVAHGTNRIERILDGCVVEENFSGDSATHLRGISTSTFDVHAGKWKQTWVDNEGGYLDFVGEFKDGQMVLWREATRPNGIHVLQRMVWKNIARDEFDWSWEASEDSGKTWKVQWPIHYKRKS